MPPQKKNRENMCHKSHNRNLVFGILSSLLLAALYLPSVYFANTQAYKKSAQFSYEKIEHPEILLPSEYTKLLSFGAKEALSDLYWVSLIQYIGGNVIQADYKKYMANMVHLITDLSKEFSYPVEVSLILLPESNKLYEAYSEKEVQSQRSAAILLGKKMMEQSCDQEKLKKINESEELSDIIANPNMANPCRNGMIPYYLGYVYYFNENNPRESARYYKIASAHNDDTPVFARNMYAIMSGKGGDRERSTYLFLSLAGNENSDNSLCAQGIQEMRTILATENFISLTKNPKFVQAVNDLYGQIVDENLANTTRDEDSILANSCLASLGKATREVNLSYIEQADALQYKTSGVHMQSAKSLFDKKLISYLPRDFQRDEDGSLEVIYYFNSETNSWDYKRGGYAQR